MCQRICASLLFLFFIPLHYIKSQIIFDDYTVESWTAKDGLPTELILSMAIDTNGFIWLNTYEGLVQFDGVNFKTYTAATHSEIKSNNIYNPVIDKQNTLWATTQFGKLLKIKKGRLEAFPLPFQMDRIMSEFENGDYMSSTPKGERVIFNPGTQEYRSFNRSQRIEFAKVLNTYAQDPFRRVKMDDGKTMILIGRTPFWLTKDSLQEVGTTLGIPPPPWSAAELLKSSTGEIFLIGDDVIKIWQNNKFITYPGCDKIVINTTGGRQHRLLVEDKKGNLWLGTANGLALRRKGNANFEFLHESHPLRSKIITALQIDYENNLWAGSENGLFKITEGKIKMLSKWNDITLLRTGGVTQVPSGTIYINVSGRSSFYKYEQGFLSPLKLKNPLLQAPWEVFHIYGDKKGNIWLASSGTSFRIAPDGKELKFGDRSSIRYVYEDSIGTIWFGVSGEGIGYLEGDSIRLLKFGNFSFNGQNISSINKINGTDWLITTFNTGLLWINSKGSITPIYDTLGYPGIGAFGTYQDAYGTFWVASTNGLFYFDRKKFIKIKDHHDYLSTSFFEILDDKRGSLWLTSNKGIIQIHKTELSDFVNNKSPAVNAKRYDEGDGMLNRQATGARHSILTQEGRIMVPTLHGLAIIDPDKMFQNIIPPHVVINGLYFNSNLVDTLPPVFEAGEHQYIFDYSATSFVAPSKVQFKFMLEGYEKEWSKLTTDRKVNYTNLPKGSYTFKVKASNNDGVWNEAGAEMSFTVKPYYFETWWFRLFALIAFSGLILGIINWRSRQILDRNRELQSQVEIRTKELKEQKSSLENTLTTLQQTQAQLIHSEKMASLGELTAGIAHEIQNPLNFVNNFSELNGELIKELEEETKSGQRNTKNETELLTAIKENSLKINHHGKRAESIVKGMLEHSSKSTGVKEPTDINKLCEEFVRFSHQVCLSGRQGKSVKDKNQSTNLVEFNCNYKLVLDPNLPLVTVVSQDIGRVILNIVNNAFQACAERTRIGQNLDPANHTVLSEIPPKDSRILAESQQAHKPLVTVSTKNKGEKIEIIISDNGPGISDSIKDKIFQPFFTTKPTGQGTGLGLSLAYDIVKAHRGIIEVNSNKSEGAEFIISLPI